MDAPEIKPTTNQLYFKGSYLRQNWSLPNSIIFYITKTPSSSKGYQKLIQSCKYFFFKNPIIVCSELIFYGRDQTSKIVIRKDGKTTLIHLKDISHNFWNTNEILIHVERTGKRNFISSLIPNIYQCDIKNLDLWYQIISLNELLFLASKANRIHLIYSTVIFEDGSVVSLERIIETFTQVQIFFFDFKDNDPSISSKTVENLLKISHFSSIWRLFFKRISEVFDIETFFAYIKKNKYTLFSLEFVDSISGAYRNRLREIVDEIIETENHDYKPPIIMFDGIDNDKRMKLNHIDSRY